MIFVIAFFGRHTADYRLLHLLTWGSLVTATGWILSRMKSTFAVLAIYSFLIVVAILPHQTLVRWSLLPLTWGKDAVSYDQARAEIRRVVPGNASIGGDPELWTLVTDGRPYYSFWTAREHWPDYMITSPACAFSRLKFSEEIPASYDEVSLALPKHNEPSDLRIGGWQFEVSPQPSDWSIRIWRRKLESAAALGSDAHAP